MNILNIIKKLFFYALIPFGILINKILKPKTLIILGMHRSGTSCITRILNQNGLYLGSEIIKPDKGNPQGYWENLSVYSINERILKLSGGSWDNPPSTLLENFYIKIEILRFLYIRNWKRSDLIIKDPRMVITWDIWKKYLRNYYILAIFRNPNSVANSLRRRDGMNNEIGLNLWETYNKKIIKISNNESIDFLNFDDENSFENKIKKIINKLELQFNPVSLNFYNSSLKSSNIKGQVKNNNLYNKFLNMCS